MESSDDCPSSVAPDLPVPDAPAYRIGRCARLRLSLAAWRERDRSRRLLAQLDEHMLRDIGIDPARVWLETGKWFWQP